MDDARIGDHAPLRRQIRRFAHSANWQSENVISEETLKPGESVAPSDSEKGAIASANNAKAFADRVVAVD
jgi:hypothetical protein